ncbi:hypothetical protein RKD25_000118 [Streptomyces sp. SAI-124]|uniref:hypothetical protein n=1 Tax=Streptomyces sp. SAI-124 TaxID=3377730 RepID=UPI003C7ED61D
MASRDSLAALRSSLGEGPRTYLEHQARRIRARFAEAVGRDVSDLALTMSRGPVRATAGQYLDNLLLSSPERVVSQYEALGIRTHFPTLDANPDRRGRALIVPAVVRMEARSYASIEQTPQTIERDSDTLAGLSINLYNRARRDRGLPPVGRPLAPAQSDYLFAPPATTAPSVRPADSTVPAELAPAPALSPAPLPPALAETAAGLVAMDADARARELVSLTWRDRESLAADRAFVEQLRAGLSVEEFTAVAARLLVVVPDGVEQPEAARAEAEELVAGMLADPQIAVALLTEGRRLVVVPRNRPMTSLEEFAGLRGRHQPGEGRSLDVARGLFDRRRGLVGVGEENLLGESTDVLGDDFYDDGYSLVRHEWAHAIESVLSAEDRQLIRDVYEAKVAADPPAQWPDEYASSSAHEYFAQLSNAYLGANTGKDSNSRRRPRNNGSDWVEQHDPALLPLLRRLYGTGRPSNLGSRDNPYVLTGFRQLWDRAEGALTGQALEEPEAEPRPTSLARQAAYERERGESPAGEPILFAPPSGDSRSRSERRSPGPTLITFDAAGEAEEMHWSQVEGASWYRQLPSVQRRRLRGTEDYTPFNDALDRMRNTVVAAVDGGAGREDVRLLTGLYGMRGNLSAFDPVMQTPFQQSVQRRTGSRELSLVRGSITRFGRHVAYTDVIVPHPGPWAQDATSQGLAASLERVLGEHSTATIITDNEMRDNSQ